MAYYGNNNTQNKSAYQQNIKQEKPKNNVTSRDVMAQISLMSQRNPNQAAEYYKKFTVSQQDSTSQFYNPYTQATNRAVNNLASLGFDVSNINDDWYNNNSWLKQYYTYTANTNSLSSTMTNKKASKEQKAAYYYDQLWKAEEQTRAAESEWSALQDELIYLAQDKGHNYSDDWILSHIDWNKYKTLTKMDDGRLSGQPIELNRAVSYSRDAMYAVLWAARNGGSTGDLWTDMVNSAGGTGWKDNPSITARSEVGNDAYAPYSLGSTMRKEGTYFGRYEFDQQWLDDNKALYMNGNDETAQKMFQSVWKAEQYTQDLEKQLKAMHSSIDDMVKNGFTAEDIIDTIKGGTTLYKDLFDLDESMESGELKDTTRAINYRWQDIEQEIRDAVANKPSALETAGNIFGNIVENGYGPLAPMFQKQEDTIGQYGAGNIDLYARTPVIDDEGNIETVNSISINVDGKEVLIPTVIDGKIVSDDDAIEHFEKTGEYLGVFDTVEDANKYATALHLQQQSLYTTQNQPPLFSDAEKAMDEDVRKSYDNLNGTVWAMGTKAEQTALLTGKTAHYDLVASKIRQSTLDFQRAFRTSSTGKIVNDYFDDYGAVADYTSHRENLSTRQEQLDGIMPEWQGYADRAAEMKSIAGLDGEQFAALQNIASLKPGEDPVIDWIVNTLRNDENNQEALMFLYETVAGQSAAREPDEDVSTQESRLANAKEWFKYIEGSNSGEFNPLTPEEQTRFNELTTQKTELEKEIGQENAYIEANQKAYMSSKMDLMFAKAGYQAAVAQDKSGKMDPGLMDKIEYVYDIGKTPTQPSYYAYSAYDYDVEHNGKTREEVTANATNDLSILRSNIDTIDETMAYLEKNGVQMDDESRKNIAAKREELMNASLNASDAALDGAKDFKAITEKAVNDALDGPDMLDNFLAKYRTTGDNWYRMNAGAVDERLASLSAIDNTEIDRYFYIKKTDGEEKARKYLERLTDPDNGMLTIRRMGDLQENLEEFSSEMGINPYIATGLNIAARLTGWIPELLYRGKQAITGQKVSPYNSAFSGRVVADATSKGIHTALSNAADTLFGKGTIVGELLGRMQDIGTSAAVYATGSKVMGAIADAASTPITELTSVFSPETLSVKLVRSTSEVLPVTLESAGGTYRNTLITTGDETKAGLMYDVSILSGLITHTVVMDGIHNAFQTNPQALTNGISNLLSKVFETDVAVGGSTIAADMINEYASKYILEADSQWQKDFDRYNKDYPSAIAQQMADADMFERITTDTLEAVANATLRTLLIQGVGAAANAMPKVKESLQNAYNKIDTAWKYVRNDFGKPNGMRVGDVANAPAEIADNIPSDAIVNPVDGFNGTTVYERHTGKARQIVAFSTSEDGTIILYDKDGTRVPFLNVVIQNGVPIDLASEPENVQTFLRDVYTTARDTWNPQEYDRVANATDASVPEGFTETPVNEETGLTTGKNLPAETFPFTPNDVRTNPVNPKDMTVLNEAYNADPTAASVSISSMFNDPDLNLTKAVGQMLVGDIADKDPKVAVAAMQQILLKADDPLAIKKDVEAATLTNGQGNQALRNIVAKVAAGRDIAKKDVNALRTGIKNDRKADPQGFDQTIKGTVVSNQVANETLSILSQDQSIKKAEESTKEAQENLNNANARVVAKEKEAEAAAENLANAAEQFDPKNKETRNLTQTAREHAIATKNDVNTAKEAAGIQQQKLEKEQAKLDDVKTTALKNAREQASATVDEQNQAEAEQRYNNAVANLTPTAPFVTARNDNGSPAPGATPTTITGYDQDGNPVTLTGVYDRVEHGRRVSNINAQELVNGGQTGTTVIMYTTADGRLVQENLGKRDRDGNLIRKFGDVVTDDDEAIYAADSLAGDNATNSDAITPPVRPEIYFPSSFPITSNGREIQMIGLAGKHSLNGEEFPVIIGLDGKKYSLADPNLEVPFDYVDVVDDTYDQHADEMREIPQEEITEVIVNANNEGRQEGSGQTGIPVQGTEGERDNGRELSPPSGRNDGSGDLSNARPDGGQGDNGRAEEGSTGTDGQTVRGVPERLLSRHTVRTLKNKGVTDMKVGLTNADTFSPALEAGRASNAHGLFVDPQSVEDLTKNGAIMIMAQNGLAGAAVETEGDKSGNIVGVFKNSRSRARNASASLIIQAVAQGGNKLDCYDGGLRRLYAKVGFVPVARVAWNDAFHKEVNPETGEVIWDDGWNYERDGKPDVVAWMLKPGETAESIAAKYGLPESEGGFHIYSTEEINNLPLFEDTVDEEGNTTEWGYDKALAYRDLCLKIGKTNPAKVELLMGQAESETFNTLRNKLLSGESLTDDDVNALYETPEVRYALDNRMEGVSLDKELIKNLSLDNKEGFAKVESQLPAEQVKEIHRILNELDSQGSAVIDENGKVSYTGEVKQERRLDLILGLAASGKSTIADRISQKYKSRFLDADQAKELHSLYMDGINEDHIHNESKFINDQHTIMAVERGDNIIAQVLGESEESVLHRINYFSGNGYSVHLHMTDLDKNKSLGRAISRYFSTGRYHDIRHLMQSDPAKIEETFNNVKGETNVDGYTKWDTDTPKGELPILLEASDGAEAAFLGGNESDLRRDSSVQSPLQAGNTGSGNNASEGVYNGKGSGGLTTEPPVNGTTPSAPPTEPPVNTPEPVDVGNLGFAVRPNPANGRMGHRQWNNEGAQESDILHQQTKDYLLNNDLYMKDTNSDQIDRALSWVKDHATQDDPSGFYGSLKEIDSGNFNFWSKDGVVRLQTMIGMAATRGDVDTEARLADKYYSEVGTDLGQALQARKVFNLMSHIGRKQILRREAQKIQDEYRVQGKKLDLKISDETLEMAANAKTEEEFAAARRKMELELAAQIPSDWRLRMRTIRMTSMLANPRTHIRNIVGNLMAIPMVEMKNAFGAALESIDKLPKGQRTKTVGRSKDSVEFAKKDADIMMPELQGTAKYYEMNNVEKERKAFGTKDTWISRTFGKGYQKVADTSSNALEKEDAKFLRYHYVRALSGWMTANGYTSADMKGKVLERGRAYAILEAQKATYRDPNTFATWLSNQQNKPAAAQWIINAVQPFIKTPANIMRRGIEYSPVGLVNAVVKRKKQLKEYKEWEDSGFKGPKPKNAKSPSEVFDSIAAGFTGTMIAGLGAYLASIGLLRVKAKDLDKLHGAQDYSLEIDGKSIGIGSIIPLNIPLLFGASLYNESADRKKDGSVDLWKVLDSISNILEPVIDTTMMTSLNSLLDTSRYTKDGTPVGTLAEKIIANYAASYVPSFVGAVAKTVDPTRRKAYIEAGGNESQNIWMAMLEQTQNKIPYLTTQNVPYINAWGKEDTNNIFGAFLQNFILPDKIQDLSDDEVDKKLEELSGVVGDSVKPGSQEKYLTVNKERVNLNDKQWYQYNSSKGKTSKAVLQELIERPEFICLTGSPEIQAELVKKVYKYAKAKATLELFPEKEITDSWTKGALKANNVIDYIFEKEEEAAKNESISSHRDSLKKSVESSNIDAAKTDIDFLRKAGIEDSSIKSTLTTYFKPIYQEAASNFDDEEMRNIRTTLIGLKIGYENYNFDNWLK